MGLQKRERAAKRCSQILRSMRYGWTAVRACAIPSGRLGKRHGNLAAREMAAAAYVILRAGARHVHSLIQASRHALVAPRRSGREDVDG